MTPEEIEALVASAQGTAASASPAAHADVQDSALSGAIGAALGGQSGAEVPLGMLFDLSLPVSIELGRTTMTVQEILRLGRGAVIQLDRLAGEPIDIYVGGRKFAEGEVVVLGEHFGVRIVRVVAANAPALVA